MQWTDLTSILEEQSTVLDSLIALHERERIALCRLDAAMLEEAVAEKNAVIERFKALERRRVELLKKEGMDEKPLKELAAVAPDEFAAQLLTIRKELRKKAEKLSEVQRMNCSLIVNAQLQMETLMSILGAVASRTYSPEGRVESDGASLFSRKA